MMKQQRSYLIAVAAGVGLIWAVPVVLATVMALPGLGGVLRAMKAAHVPMLFFSILVKYLPMVSVSFLVGAALRRYVRATGFRHLLVCAATWIAYVIWFLVSTYSGTDVSWLGELPGAAMVPLGLLLAGFVRPPPSLHPAEAQGLAATRDRLARRLPSR